MTHESGEGRDAMSIDGLLEELTELRELDPRRNTHAPGSQAHDRITRELEDRTRRLMDRFRDIKLVTPRTASEPAPHNRDATFLHVARPSRGTTIGSTRTG